MNPNIQDILISLKDNDSKKYQEYSNIKIENIKTKSEEYLVLLVIKLIFFFDDNSFTKEKIIEQRQKYDWLNSLFIEFIGLCIRNNDLDDFYKEIKRLLTYNYPDIFNDYNNFVQALKHKKETSEIDYDLFDCFVSFLCFVNGNNKYLDIIEELNKDKIVLKLKSLHCEQREKSLLKVLKNYCSLFEFPDNSGCYLKSGNISSIDIDVDLNELKCYVELCSTNELFQKFFGTIYSNIKDLTDIRQNKSNEIKIFIETIFSSLIIYMNKFNYMNEFFLLQIICYIYKNVYNYTSREYNENYFDFVICYMTEYQISSDEFLNLFLNGLNAENFDKTFSKMDFKETIGDINDKETIKNLINQISIKGKKIKKKKNKIERNKENSMEKNEIKMPNEKCKEKIINNSLKKEAQIQINISPINTKEEKKADNMNKIQSIYREKKFGQNSVNDSNCRKIAINEIENINIKDEELKNNSEEIKETMAKFQRGIIKEVSEIMKNEISELKLKNEELINKISVLSKKNDELIYKVSTLEKKNDELEKKNEELIEKNEELKKQIDDLKEENEDLKSDISNLKKDNQTKNIKIKELDENIKTLSRNLEIISFRDLSKRILDNMINFVKKK